MDRASDGQLLDGIESLISSILTLTDDHSNYQKTWPQLSEACRLRNTKFGCEESFGLWVGKRIANHDVVSF